MENSNYSTEQVMMTLCAIAYEENAAKFNKLLRSKSYATQDNWEIVWGPATNDLSAFSMFVAQNKHSNEKAVVIRGSVLSADHPIQTIIDWMDDLNVFSLAALSNDLSEGKISAGSHQAFKHLQEMRDPATNQTVLTFLQQEAASKIIITGHSLGGMLTSIITAWLRSKLPKRQVIAYSFAAPTAGDADFASFVEAKDYYRFWNEWDFVPQGFEERSMLDAIKWYPAPGQKMNLAEKLLIDGLVAMRPKPNPYTQPAGVGIMLDGTLLTSASFAQQLAHQHDANTYLSLLGAPKVKYSAA